MLKDITLGQFFPGHSFVHKMDARVKIICVILYIAWLFFVKTFAAYGVIAVFLAVVIISSKTPFKTVLSAFASRNIVSMLAVIAAIFVFKDAMQKTGVVGQLTGLAGGDAALFVAAILLPMLVGLISGITMAFVGAAFPLLLDLLAALGVSGEARTAWVILALVSGFTGIMASPLHICFIFSCQYFGVNISAVWRRLLAPSALLFATGVTLFFCYR